MDQQWQPLWPWKFKGWLSGPRSEKFEKKCLKGSAMRTNKEKLEEVPKISNPDIIYEQFPTSS